ncbi:MAG: DNA-formamidopyrimidine glycosylase family protein [Flavihumibacter sp.]
MPEGPTIILAAEKLSGFIGKTVQKVAGYKNAPQRSLKGRRLTAIHTWGKHLLLVFGDRTLRVHFLLFGSMAVNPGDKRRAKLALHFTGGDTMAFYLCSLEMITEPLADHYDWTVDILSAQWKPANAVKKMAARGDMLICDCLMDQQIVSGSGNIIKNETLFRARLHPMSRAGEIPLPVLRKLVGEVRRFAKAFLRYKRADTLNRHLLVYEQTECPRCHIPLQRKELGKTKRLLLQQLPGALLIIFAA